jgi:sugar phosphate isomerase/epimerase
VNYTDAIFAAMNINRAEFIAGLGGNAVVLHLPARKCETTAEAIRQSVALLNTIRPAFEALGVRGAVENLPWPVHSDEFLNALFNEFGPGFLGFCYDSGHAAISRQAHLLARHIDRLLVTHLHDNDGKQDQHRLPGEGVVDWPEIVRVLKQSSYRGTVNLELQLPNDAPLAAFCQRAHDVLTRLWGRRP